MSGRKKGISGKDKAQIQQPRLTRADENYPKDIPDDWDEKDYEKFWLEGLTEVMNQGLLMASTRVLSAWLFIKKKVKTLKSLSNLHLAVGLYDKTVGDLGELVELVHLQRFLVENGAILVKDCKCTDPFSEKKKGKSKIAKPILCTEKYKNQPKSIFKVRNLVMWTKIQVNEQQLLRVVREESPVAISIPFTMEFAKFKGDGVYEGTNRETADRGYHMMVCHGFGTHKGKIHYWKVQNSLGLTWGEDGFGKIIRQTSRAPGKPSLIHFVLYPVLLEGYVDED